MQRCSALTHLTSQKQEKCRWAAITTDVQSRFLPTKHRSRQSCRHTFLHYSDKENHLLLSFVSVSTGSSERRAETDTFTDWTNTCWHILHAVPRAGPDLLINMIFINSDNIWGILSSFLVFWLRHTGVSGHFTSISLFFLPRVSFSSPPPLSPPPPSFSSSCPSLLPLLPHPERRSFTEGQTEPDSSSDSRFPSPPLGVWISLLTFDLYPQDQRLF